MIKDKGFKKICSILLISAIILPFIINGIYGFVLKHIPGTMYANDSDVWISFLGGFLGAGITLLGIYWQINESKKEKELEKISDAYEAYVMLEKWVEVLAIKLIGIEEMNELDKIIEKRGGDKLKEVPVIFQKSYNEDLIYSFIQNSVLSEKRNLIDRAYHLNTLVFGFEKLLLNNSSRQKEKTIFEFIEEYIKMTKKLMNDIKNDRKVFEEKYKEELGI